MCKIVDWMISVSIVIDCCLGVKLEGHNHLKQQKKKYSTVLTIKILWSVLELVPLYATVLGSKNDKMFSELNLHSLLLKLPGF